MKVKRASKWEESDSSEEDVSSPQFSSPSPLTKKAKKLVVESFGSASMSNVSEDEVEKDLELLEVDEGDL
jgi:hypothetical protein